MAWRIAPGKVGGVLSRGGFHVVRRPPLEEVRDRLRVYAESLATRRADSVYADSLVLARGLTLGENVAARLRAFFNDPSVREHRHGVRWRDGSMASSSCGDASVWIDMLPARAYLDLRGTSDVILERFTRELGQQALMLGEARKHGIDVTPSDWTALYEGYRRAVGASLALLGADSSGDHSGRPGGGPGHVAARSIHHRFHRLPAASERAGRGAQGTGGIPAPREGPPVGRGGGSATPVRPIVSPSSQHNCQWGSHAARNRNPGLGHPGGMRG